MKKQAPARDPQIVAVIASAADFQRATRLRRQPDFFELRLDSLAPISAEIFQLAPKLRAPLLITARHPAEGGANCLSGAQRRNLLLRFLPIARGIDVELRSVAAMRGSLETARDRGVTRIVSMHDFQRTPPAKQLAHFAKAAIDAGADILKLATRTNSIRDVEILVSFFRTLAPHMSVSVMPMGPAVRPWRLLLAREGSALNYTHLGRATVEGQWSFAEFRRALARDVR